MQVLVKLLRVNRSRCTSATGVVLDFLEYLFAALRVSFEKPKQLQVCPLHTQKDMINITVPMS
jgi:hypothetical protein